MQWMVNASTEATKFGATKSGRLLTRASAAICPAVLGMQRVDDRGSTCVNSCAARVVPVGGAEPYVMDTFSRVFPGSLPETAAFRAQVSAQHVHGRRALPSQDLHVQERSVLTMTGGLKPSSCQHTWQLHSTVQPQRCQVPVRGQLPAHKQLGSSQVSISSVAVMLDKLKPCCSTQQ